MNVPDPRESASFGASDIVWANSSLYRDTESYGIDATHSYGDVAAICRPHWDRLIGSYVDGGVPTITQGNWDGVASNASSVITPTTQPCIGQTVISSIGGDVATTAYAGLTSNTLTAYTTTSISGTTVADRPAAKPLEVRRYYHWNLSKTAGSADASRIASRPNTAARVEIADDPPMAGEGHGAIRVADKRSNLSQLVHEMVPSARSLTRLAAFLAGRKSRPGLLEEWRSHLAGDTGRELSGKQKFLAVLGFLASMFRDLDLSG